MRTRLAARWPEIVWGLFAAVNLAVIVALSKWETIPFHLLWVSLTLVYGIRVWRLRPTLVVLASVMLLSAGALLWTVMRGHERLDEVAEVPLMAAMFVAMVWHARQRQAAVERAERLARTEHVLLERQREFVRDASHELRTPITVARGHVDLARAASPDGPRRDDLDIVADELDRLSMLSERLLLLAAADHPGFLSIREVEVGPLLEQTIRRWRAAADRRWRLDVAVLGTVPADPQRLSVALDALIENAVAATDAGQEIRLSARDRDGRVIVEVADDGVGIPAERLGRVFERFARADVDRGRGSGGTGLGLAIVKGIVEAHGGSASVASGNCGGAAIALELPGFRPAADRAAGHAADRGVATDGSSAVG